MFVQKNNTAQIEPLDESIIRACRANCHAELLVGAVNSELQVTELLETLKLRNVAYSIGLAWGKITPIAGKKCTGQNLSR
jgi:hypothetical protein